MWQPQSSNPVLNNNDAFQEYYGGMAGTTRSDVTTLSGVVNKTGILVLVAIGAGGAGYSLFAGMPAVLPIASIAAFIIALGVYFVMRGKPQLAPIMAPVYAIVEGVFLGALTAMVDNILAQRGLAVFGGAGLQALVITFSLMISMLLLYKAKLIRPTARFQAVMRTLVLGIMLAYLATFLVSLFGIRMPLISFASAASDTGMMGLLGLGINVVFLVIASLFLIIDFGMVEENVNAGAPKYMEWYCGFALLVTLAWIYLEALKLVLRLAVLFGGRD